LDEYGRSSIFARQFRGEDGVENDETKRRKVCGEKKGMLQIKQSVYLGEQYGGVRVGGGYAEKRKGGDQKFGHRGILNRSKPEQTGGTKPCTISGAEF